MRAPDGGREIAPRFDYGRKPHELHITERGALFTSQDMDLAVHPVREPRDERLLNLCTVMYVEALARAGRTDQARPVLEKMLTYANHLGLHPYEIGLTGRQLGNLPQAFTHLALIDAANTLDAKLNGARGGGTWSPLGPPPPEVRTAVRETTDARRRTDGQSRGHAVTANGTGGGGAARRTVWWARGRR